MSSSDTVSRFNRRRLTTKLVALRPMLIGAAVVALAGFGAWVVLFSSWLAAQHVSVVGESTLSAQTVQAAADVSIGTPLVRLDVGQIQARVAALPAVRSVTVRRSWPDTVSISITERTAVAAIHRNGSWWVLDDQGVLFRTTPARDRGVPVIAVPRKAGADAVREAATVVGSLPAAMLAETKRLTASSMDSITLRLKDKTSVVWGSSAESHLKVEVAQALLAHTKARIYDVSVPEQPATSR